MTVPTIDNTPCCTFVAHNARTRRPVPSPGSSRLLSVSAERGAPFRTVFAQKKRTSLRMSSCGIRRRPTLPGRFQPGTISVLRLNFCVRDGNRWIPQAIVTGNFGLRFSAPSKLHRIEIRFALSGLTMTFDLSLLASLFSKLPTNQFRLLRFRSQISVSGLSLRFRSGFSCSLFPVPFSLFLDQALDRLVSSSSIPYGTSTDDLSTLSS